MHERSQQILRHVLESSFANDQTFINAVSVPDKVIFNKARYAYEACMNEEQLKKLGSDPLIQVLRMIQELFPAITPKEVLENPQLSHPHQEPLLVRRATDEKLTKIITYFEKIGVAALVSFGIGVCTLSCYK